MQNTGFPKHYLGYVVESTSIPKAVITHRLVGQVLQADSRWGGMDWDG